MHVMHEVSWDLTDASGKAVADGSYRVLVEVTDRDAKGQTIAVELTTSSTPQIVRLDDTSHFADVELRYE